MLIVLHQRQTKVSRLVITTESGAEFAIEERDGGLYVKGQQRMFVQWDGPAACEIRQLGGHKCHG